MQLVANSCARLSRRLTLVEALQDEVYCKAPEEEATSCAAGNEERGDQEEESEADSEEGVDEGRGDSKEQACC